MPKLEKILENAGMLNEDKHLRAEADLLHAFASLNETMDRVFCLNKENQAYPIYYSAGHTKQYNSDKKRLVGVAKGLIEDLEKKLKEAEQAKEEKK